MTDSNGANINPQQLKPGAQITKITRYTITEATTNIPKIHKPEEIRDIVFKVGLNDLRKGSSPKQIQEGTLDMQIKYQEKFQNARQHIMALPPLDNEHTQVNTALQKLSKHTESNFISTKPFQDRITGKLRANTMKGFHYNDLGVKLIAKEMKKSLFSTANIGNTQLISLRLSRLNNKVAPTTTAKASLLGRPPAPILSPIGPRPPGLFISGL